MDSFHMQHWRIQNFKRGNFEINLYVATLENNRFLIFKVISGKIYLPVIDLLDAPLEVSLVEIFWTSKEKLDLLCITVQAFNKWSVKELVFRIVWLLRSNWQFAINFWFLCNGVTCLCWVSTVYGKQFYVVDYTWKNVKGPISI